MNKQSNTESWTEVIQPSSSLFELKLGEIWRYRDLLILFIKRDFIAQYKQTLLGPLWYIIQPILTAAIYYVIFNRVAGISTGAVPPILYYLSTIALWNYFSSCLTSTASTFISNQHIFGKVYFPRLIAPLAVTISNLVKLGIQLGLFLIVWIYMQFNGLNLHINWSLLPLLLPIFLTLAILSLSLGILISSLTTKYRDLQFLIGFGVQLLMYCTPVIYPLSKVPGKFRDIVLLNPLTSIIEAFKAIFFGSAEFTYTSFALSFGISAALFVIALAIFNKVERSFMDTI